MKYLLLNVEEEDTMRLKMVDGIFKMSLQIGLIVRTFHARKGNRMGLNRKI